MNRVDNSIRPKSQASAKIPRLPVMRAAVSSELISVACLQSCRNGSAVQLCPSSLKPSCSSTPPTGLVQIIGIRNSPFRKTLLGKLGFRKIRIRNFPFRNQEFPFQELGILLLGNRNSPFLLSSSYLYFYSVCLRFRPFPPVNSSFPFRSIIMNLIVMI